MLSIKDLQNNNIVGNLGDDNLKKLIPIIKVLDFKKGDKISKKGNKADTFYMLKSGRIFLKQKISSGISLNVATISPGESFGWASIFKEGAYLSEAVCAEDSVVFSITGNKIHDLIEKDNSMGYKILKKIMVNLNERINLRTKQFLNAIKAHPEIHNIVK